MTVLRGGVQEPRGEAAAHRPGALPGEAQVHHLPQVVLLRLQAAAPHAHAQRQDLRLPRHEEQAFTSLLKKKLAFVGLTGPP